jgi:hypothetical protein
MQGDLAVDPRHRAEKRRITPAIQLGQPAGKELMAGAKQLSAHDHNPLSGLVAAHLDRFNGQVIRYECTHLVGQNLSIRRRNGGNLNRTKQQWAISHANIS